MKSEQDDMVRRTICGQGFVLFAHGGRLLRGGRLLVALKMVTVVVTMERMISEQLKLTPRRKNLAARTRIFAFCRNELDFLHIYIYIYICPSAYQVSFLLLVRRRLHLLEDLFFLEGWASDHIEIFWRSTRRLERAFQRTSHR